jgi:hypothetical protein
MSYELQTDANDLIQSHFTVFIRRTFVSCLMSCDILDAFVHREKMVCQMAEMGHSRRVRSRQRIVPLPLCLESGLQAGLPTRRHAGATAPLQQSTPGIAGYAAVSAGDISSWQ